MNLFLMCGRCSTMENTHAVCLCVRSSSRSVASRVCVLRSSGFNVNELQSRVQIVKWFPGSSCVKEPALPDALPRNTSGSQSGLSLQPSTRKPQHVPLRNPSLTRLSNQSTVLSCSGAVWPGQPPTNEQAHPSIPLYSLIH